MWHFSKSWISHVPPLNLNTLIALISLFYSQISETVSFGNNYQTFLVFWSTPLHVIFILRRGTKAFCLDVASSSITINSDLTFAKTQSDQQYKLDVEKNEMIFLYFILFSPTGNNSKPTSKYFQLTHSIPRSILLFSKTFLSSALKLWHFLQLFH